MNRFGKHLVSLLFALVLAPVALGGSLPGGWRKLPAAPVLPDGYLTSAWTGTQLVVFGRRQITKLDSRDSRESPRRLSRRDRGEAHPGNRLPNPRRDNYLDLISVGACSPLPTRCPRRMTSRRP